MNKYLIVLVTLLIFISDLTAQTTDLARIEYTWFPQADSDNSFRRFRSFINFPIKVKEDAYLVPGFEYRNVNLKFNDAVPFDSSELDRFESFKLSLGYTFKLNEKWRFGAQANVRAASNFSNGGIQSDDILYTGAIYFINDNTSEEVAKPWRLILGAQYNTQSGRPFPLPIVNYFKKFHPNWSYVLGVPKTNIKRYFGSENKHIISVFVTLDGFFANLQENKQIPFGEFENQTAENISMTVVLSGIGYEFKFTDHLLFYFYGGYTLANDIRLRDGNANTVFTINDKNSFYGRSGIKFKI